MGVASSFSMVQPLMDSARAVCPEADGQADQTEHEKQGEHAGGALLQLVCHAWHVQASWASLAAG